VNMWPSLRLGLGLPRCAFVVARRSTGFWWVVGGPFSLVLRVCGFLFRASTLEAVFWCGWLVGMWVVEVFLPLGGVVGAFARSRGGGVCTVGLWWVQPRVLVLTVHWSPGGLFWCLVGRREGPPSGGLQVFWLRRFGVVAAFASASAVVVASWAFRRWRCLCEGLAPEW